MIARVTENTSEVADIYEFSIKLLFNTSIKDDIEKLKEILNDDSLIIPKYWRDVLSEKEATINNANESLGCDGVSFVFLTDYHQTSSNKASTTLIKHIFEHTSVDTMFYGGDTTDGGSMTAKQCIEKIREYMNELKPLNVFNIRGNHDCEPTANSTKNQISDSQYYDLCIRPIEKLINTGKKPYYYYDNKSQNVRYIVMDSGGMNNPLNSTQLEWLKSKLTELSEDWTVIIFQHMVVEQNSTEQTIHIGTRGQLTLNAIGEVYNQLNCTIGALICGHAHVDGILSTDYNFNIIATTCDSGGANSAGDWNNPTRPSGTTNECAFDVFSINTNTKEITITRIGAGNDRVTNY